MEKKITPFVSIVIPTRDRADLLVAVLEFIQKQTFKNFEVIISDNGVVEPCFEKVKKYLADDRFNYKRPEKPLGMHDHWEFATEGAQGECITIFNEKYIFRRDALEILFAEYTRNSPDVISWQYDWFESESINENGKLFGTFHPRIKPNPIKSYDNVEALKRRFSFEYPCFCRKNKHLDSYGKVYGGLVKRELLNKIKKKYGRLFHPGSPDFTSMIAILNEGKTFVDISQSLVLFVNDGKSSNGIEVSKSAEAHRGFLNTVYSNIPEYLKSLPIMNYWIGIENHLARDYLLMQSLAKSGPVTKLILDKVALTMWAQREYNVIEDWGDMDNVSQINIINELRKAMNDNEKQHFNNIKKNIEISKEPNSTYIYHSGVRQTSNIEYGLPAEKLAELNWQIGVANQATNISTKPISLADAESYLYEYNLHSCRLLGIDNT